MNTAIPPEQNPHQEQFSSWFEWLDLPLDILSDFGMDVVLEFLTGLLNL